MATQSDPLKPALDSQIAGQIADSRVTDVAQSMGKAHASSQSVETKPHKKKKKKVTEKTPPKKKK